MTKTECRRELRRIESGWLMASYYEDGEYGICDASSRMCEHLMREVPHTVIGIYRKGQDRFFERDLRNVQSSAWKLERAA